MNKKLKLLYFQCFIFFVAILYSLVFHLFDFFSCLFKKKQADVKSNILKDYLEKNYALWSRNNTQKSNKVLITNFVHHPGYTITESIIGKHICNFYNFEACGLIDIEDKFGKKIIKSFEVKNFIHHPKLSLFKRLKYLLIAFIKIKNIENIDRFISFSIDGINYGRCIYDHILRNTSGGTLEKINFKVLFFLSEAIFYNNFYKNLFLNNNYKYLIMSETQFLPSNIIFQNALGHNVKVISRIGGTKKIGVRLYEKNNQKFQSNIKISKNEFNGISRNLKDIYSKKGYEIIKNLYDGKRTNNDPASAKNYIYEKNDLKTPKDLIKYFKWDESKKVCTIYSHNLFDGNYYNEWRIFRDNLTWLRKTLTYVKNNKLNVNWIVKDHPSDYGKNRSKNTTYKEFIKIIGKNDNIKFFPKEFNSKVLKDVTDCLFTSQGSAGLEFPCFGIPSIICGDAYYQGLGFTLEPKNEIEYYEVIDNLNKIITNGLNTDQINSARSAYYFSEELIRAENPLLFDYSILRNLDLNNFFLTAASKVTKYNMKGDFWKTSLKNQLESNKRHFIVES